MRCVAVMACALVAMTAAAAAECPNPEAIGTSRILAIDPTEHPRVGTMQYRDTLPLADKEVVLTFDDGPLPPYTDRLLQILASECVKATFFVVGQMARAYPQIVRHLHRDGHTIGTHSHTHPKSFDQLEFARAQLEIEEGFAVTAAALGNATAVAPFFRFPGLNRTPELENYLASRARTTWSMDVPSDDWRGVDADEVIRRSIARLEAKRKGILLLHDIQPVAVLALPRLLQELKARGFRIVHVVPSQSTRLKPIADRDDWAATALPTVAARKQPWPRAIPASIPATVARQEKLLDPFGPNLSHLQLGLGGRTTRAKVKWPRVASAEIVEPTLPVPDLVGLVLDDFENSSSIPETLRSDLLVLVRSRGLEPPRVAPLAPQASASTNSATTAMG
jgi:peptidoglycan/xylan/chitin deacetylase (PgdA/CDA1 family)